MQLGDLQVLMLKLGNSPKSTAANASLLSTLDYSLFFHVERSVTVITHSTFPFHNRGQDLAELQSTSSHHCLPLS